MQKPWNIPNLPVYSLVTYNQGLLNMNICTYVSAMSMQPKLFAIGVYNNTKTLENIEQSNVVVLQLLHQSHANLVKKLGQTTGFNYNKEAYLNKKGILVEWNGLIILKELSAVVMLNKIEAIQTGDHKLFVFEAIKHKSFNKDYLTLDFLREKKIIRG
jgi:flavin reductase (DIM6/NTAB) family NADH-FMN oxidoreductase RutF